MNHNFECLRIGECNCVSCVQNRKAAAEVTAATEQAAKDYDVALREVVSLTRVLVTEMVANMAIGFPVGHLKTATALLNGAATELRDEIKDVTGYCRV